MEEKNKNNRTIPLQALNALQEEESMRREEHAESSSSGASFHSEEYQYFFPDEFEKGLHISEAERENARRLIRRGEIRLRQFYTGTETFSRTNEVLGEALFTLSDPSGYPVPYNLDMIFSRTKVIVSRCSMPDCNPREDSRSYLHRTLCVHEAAGLLLAEDYLREHPELDATTPDMSRFMRDVESLRGTNLRHPEDSRRVMLRMEPLLSLLSSGTLLLSFRIGASRMYKIRDLEEFLNNMTRRQEMAFGKKTVLKMSPDYLDETSLQWYRFFVAARKADQSLRDSLADAGSRLPEKPDSIVLSGYTLDNFLRTAEGRTMQLKEPREGSRQITVSGEPYSPHLDLKPDIHSETGALEGVILSGRLPRLFTGAETACCLAGDKLYILKEEMQEGLESLYQAASYQYRLNMRVGRIRMGEFYHKILPALRQIADIHEEDPDLINGYLPPEPVLTVYLDYDNGLVLCRPEAAYGREVFSMTDLIDWNEKTSAAGTQDQYRDRDSEKRVLRQLETYFPHYDRTLRILYNDADDDLLFKLLDHGLDELLSLCEVRTTDAFRRLGMQKPVKFQMGISLESNLMNLSVTSRDVDEEELLNILDQYRKKKRFVRLRNGNFLKLENNESVDRLSRMMEELHLSLRDMTAGKMHIPAYRSLYLDKMLEGQADIYADRDRHFRKLIQEFKTVSDSEYDVPGELESIVRPYQARGYQWLRTLDHYGFGGILADEMGLGKSLQTLAVLKATAEEEAEDETRPKLSLIVCPASLVYNWLEEVRKFTPDLRAAVITGTASSRAGQLREIREKQNQDILITSYDLLKRDIQEYSDFQFRFEIIDEAQYIKNHSTAASKSVKLIHADTRYALTGTPIENRLSELWSIFDYLMPGFLYDYSSFRDELEKPIMKQGEEAALERLRRMVAPFILRRCKKDVLTDLPEKIEETHFAGMDSRQRKLYDAQVVQMRNTIRSQDDSDFSRRKIEILAELMRLRQICCDPDLCFSNYRGGSCKTEMCMDLIRNLIDGGHKTLLFSQFTSMLEILQTKLDAAGIPYYLITGKTPKETRLKLVNQFNRDETPLFLISLKAGGTGLNLTGADSVIHYDPWWNTAAEDQATDRAHRIGQTNVVTVYKLVVKDTIEEKIIDLQNRKARLAEDILSGDAVSSSTLTREELLEILR